MQLEFNEKNHTLHVDIMDRDHKEFIRLYSVADTNSFEDIKNKFMVLIEHAKKHFKEEESLMENYDYPRIREHKEEHQKVIAEMEYFLALSSNRFGLGMMRSFYINKIPEWFNLHLLNMDSDLSAHVNKNS
jgi:hemerythrin